MVLIHDTREKQGSRVRLPLSCKSDILGAGTYRDIDESAFNKQLLQVVAVGDNAAEGLDSFRDKVVAALWRPVRGHRVVVGRHNRPNLCKLEPGAGLEVACFRKSALTTLSSKLFES